MNLLVKFRETALSVLPVMVLVFALGLTAVPANAAPPHWLARFAVGGVLLIAGLTVFLLGVDLGIQPMGERCGAALTRKRNLGLLLGAAFVIGFVVTAAEPDIQVFGTQVRDAFPSVRKSPLVFSIAGGVGLFMTLGLLRTVAGLSIKWTLFLSYTALAALALFAPGAFLGVAFDSGGATTGPMTVPFIMAIGLGASSVRADSQSGFGLTGVASVGPVLAVLAYSLFLGGGGENAALAAGAEGTAESAAGAEGVLAPFVAGAGPALREALVSIAPLYGLFLVFQFTLLRMTARQILRLTIGFVYALAGLAVFLLGVNGGFMQAGQILGVVLGKAATDGGAGWYALLLGTGLVLGAVIVCAEPAVWVLSEQVEQATDGMIRRKTLLVFLSVGTATAIGLSMWRAVAGFPLWYVLVPGYLAAMLLMIRAPAEFTGIAFDSGGVASGPLTSTFILSFALGAASGGSGSDDRFGVIALVAMMPLVAIQLMGIQFDRKRRRSK